MLKKIITILHTEGSATFLNIVKTIPWVPKEYYILQRSENGNYVRYIKLAVISKNDCSAGSGIYKYVEQISKRSTILLVNTANRGLS